jgi:hypothetical protein
MAEKKKAKAPAKAKRNTNQTRETKASVTAFVDKIADASQRADAKILTKLMQDASGEKAAMWGPAIIGFGSYHYVYDSGREGDMPLIAFSPRKAGTVLYVARDFAGADGLLAKLGKYKISGSCTHIKKLSDVDQGALKTFLARSAAAMRKKKFPAKA